MNAAKTLTLETIAAATTAELVAFYNAHATPAVKKFADRKTAERRVAALLSPAAKTTETSNGATVVRRSAKDAATPATKAPNSVFEAAKPAAKGKAKAEPTKAEKAPSDAATRLYEVVGMDKLKRGAIFDVCATLAAKGTFTREDFVAELSKIANVRALGHFYWAKAHDVIAPAAAKRATAKKAK